MSLRVQVAEYYSMLPVLQSSKSLKVSNTFFFLFWFTYIYDMILRSKQAREKRESKLWKGGDSRALWVLR